MIRCFKNIYKPPTICLRMAKVIVILTGLIFLLVPIYAWIVDFAGFGMAAISFLKGGLVWILILIGALSLVIGLNSLVE